MKNFVKKGFGFLFFFLEIKLFLYFNVLGKFLDLCMLFWLEFEYLCSIYFRYVSVCKFRVLYKRV